MQDLHGTRRPSVGEQFQVARLEAFGIQSVAVVEGEHEKLAEAVGIAVEGGGVDVWDGRPFVAELGRQLDAVSELQPQIVHVEIV